MQKRFVLGFAIWAVLGGGFGYAADEGSPVDRYKQDRTAKRAYERFLYAKEMLETSPDAGVIGEAVQDAVRYATNNDENTKALTALESALERLPADGGDWREAMLARGKLLARLNRRGEAEALFQNAIEKNWTHAMWRYSESLIESDAMAEACVLECQRIAGLEKYQNYRGEEESLEIFLTLLRLTKDFDRSISLVADVGNQLESIADKPEYVRIARALCQAEDGDTDGAVAILEELNIELSETPEHREYKHLPLYKASILFKEGKNYPAAVEAFTEFMNRNAGKNQKIIASALRLARDLEIEKINRSKMDEFAGFVINSRWFQDENVQEELSKEDIAGLYDMKQIGLMNSGYEEEALEICKHVIKYFQGTLASANCNRTIAQTLLKNETLNEVYHIFKQILKETDDDTLTAIVHFQLAKILKIKKDKKESLIHIREALSRISPYSKGVMLNARNVIVQYEKAIVSN